MKCMSCSEEINAKFKYAIEANTCPFCGSVIMVEELKNLLTDLRSIMDKLNSYPDELKDFLKNNYDLVKSSEVQPTLKVGGKLPKASLEVTSPAVNEEGLQVMGESLLEQEKINSIMSRAGAAKINSRTNHLKHLVSHIKSGKATTEDIANLSDEDIDALDQNELSELHSAFDGNSNLETFEPAESSFDDDSVPSHVLAFANKKGNMSSSEAKDLARLQNMVRKSQNGSGKINRSH